MTHRAAGRRRIAAEAPAPVRVALLVDTSTGYSTQLIQGVAQYAREHGRWQLLLEPRGSRERWQMPRHWRPDGVIARVMHRSLVRDLDKLAVPVVNVSRSVLPEHACAQVTIDERKIGAWAAAHLLERGLRHFGYCGLTAQPHYTDGCGPEFRDQLASRGFACRIFRSFSQGGAARAAPTLAERKRWLRSLPAPAGVFATSIEDAYALNEVCRACRLRVPEDIAILCGEDDPLLGTIVDPPLSCIDLDSKRVGYEAAAELDRLLAGAAPPGAPRLVAPQRIVARQSTDTVAVDDPELARAMQFIRAKATTPIDVTDVLRVVPLSRRLLEQRFKRVFGRSPAAEIRRVRVERAKELLAATDWSMPRIAAAAGFSQTEVMNQVFRRELKLTPSAYRRNSRPGGPPAA